MTTKVATRRRGAAGKAAELRYSLLVLKRAVVALTDKRHAFDDVLTECPPVTVVGGAENLERPSERCRPQPVGKLQRLRGRDRPGGATASDATASLLHNPLYVALLLVAGLLAGCGAQSVNAPPARHGQTTTVTRTITTQAATTRTPASDANGVVCPSGTVARGMGCYGPSGGDPGVNPISCPSGYAPEDGGCAASNSPEGGAYKPQASPPTCSVVADYQQGATRSGQDDCRASSGSEFAIVWEVDQGPVPCRQWLAGTPWATDSHLVMNDAYLGEPVCAHVAFGDAPPWRLIARAIATA